MTKRHFESIARILREATGLPDHTRAEMARRLADFLEGENGRFDRQKFLAAATKSQRPNSDEKE